MLGFLYLLFGVIIVLYTALRFKRKRIDTVFVINVATVMYYIVPALRRIMNHTGFVSIYYLTYKYDVTPTYSAFFCILLFYSVFFVVFHLRVHVQNKRQTSYFINNEIRKTKTISVFIMIFSSITFLFYCSLYGGVINVFKSVALIRDGLVVSSDSKYDFVQKLYGVAIFAPVLLSSYYKERTVSRGLIIVSFIIAIAVLVSSGSRGGFLLFFLIFVISGINTNKKDLVLLLRFIQLFVVFVFFVVMYRPLLTSLAVIRQRGIKEVFDAFWSSLQSGGRYSISSVTSMFSSLLNSFDHYYVSLETSIIAVKRGDFVHNYIVEFGIALISLLPSLLLGIKKSYSLTYYNSRFISGDYGIAQIPPGIIGSAYYSGGFVWIAVYSILVALFAIKLESLYKRTKDTIGFSHNYYSALLFVFFSFSFSGDFSSELQKNLTTIILIVILRLKMRKKNETMSYSTN